MKKKVDQPEVFEKEPVSTGGKPKTGSEGDTRDISIWIDSYEDLFSDFDPRAFIERNISEDFLDEIKKICDENEHEISELKLLVPTAKRNAEQEATIIKRMHSFFKKNHSHVHQQIVTGKRKGFLIAFSGIVLLLGASYISYLKFVNFMMHAAVVVLEPAGWYLIWSGIESTMDSWKKRRPDFSFYHKMAKSRIVFASI